MNCHSYRSALISRVGSETAEFDSHRSTCRACRLFSERYSAAEQVLATPAASEKDRRPPAGFAADLIAALPERPSPLAWASLRLLPATGALALVLLAWCWLATPRPDELWSWAGEDPILVWVLGEDGGDG